MIKVERSLPSTNISSWLNYSSTSIGEPLGLQMVYSWDFTTQGNTGWTVGTYTSSGSGGPYATWRTTYWEIYSGNDGPGLNYSSASVTQNTTINSSEQLVIYFDGRTYNTTNNGVSIGQNITTAETRYYGTVNRSAIRIGVSNATVSETSINASAISFWASGGSIITQGYLDLYGIYVAPLSQETELQNYLIDKGLSIY